MAQIDTEWVSFLSPVIAGGSAYLVWRASQKRMERERRTRDLAHHEHLFADATMLTNKWREACEVCEAKLVELEARVERLLLELDMAHRRTNRA